MSSMTFGVLSKGQTSSILFRARSRHVGSLRLLATKQSDKWMSPISDQKAEVVSQKHVQ
jgi:hypothetical protein